MHLPNRVDKDGRYSFLLGPGDYKLSVQTFGETKEVDLTIPADKPPAELVQNFELPRATMGPLKVTIVDERGKPIPSAVLEGMYNAQAIFTTVTADARGTVRVRRVLEPLELTAYSPDGSLGAIARMDAETGEIRMVVRPTATAIGRLVDEKGEPICGQLLEYGLQVELGAANPGVFRYGFGQRLLTDKSGKFRLTGLIPDEMYRIFLHAANGTRYAPSTIDPIKEELLNLGDVAIDLTGGGLAPLTPVQLAAKAFASAKPKGPREIIANQLVEAKGEYTRPLLLLGQPKDEECVQLFTLFDKHSASRDEAKQPGDLRWEFELATLDATRDDVKTWSKEMGLDAGGAVPRCLIVLDGDGKVSARFDLELDADKKLNSQALVEFLAANKLRTRDAETMLSIGLTKAKAQKKKLFLTTSASWCGPCRLLTRFLAAHMNELEKHYVFVKLDIDRDEHTKEVTARFQKKGELNGVPWFVILDVGGETLITSNAPAKEADRASSNIGFPSTPADVAHFLNMLKQTAPGMSAEALKELQKALQK